jgi:uncharacterized protein
MLPESGQRRRHRGADFVFWIVSPLFLEGTMRGCSPATSAGVVLYASRLERPVFGLRSADYYFRRTLWLVVFGLVNAYLLLRNGDILFTYGIVGLFLWVFRDLSARTLLGIAVPVLPADRRRHGRPVQLRDLAARAATAFATGAESTSSRNRRSRTTRNGCRTSGPAEKQARVEAMRDG